MHCNLIPCVSSVIKESHLNIIIRCVCAVVRIHMAGSLYVEVCWRKVRPDAERGRALITVGLNVISFGK